MIQNTLLPKVRGIIKQDYNLSHLTWLKVGGKADIFFKPHDIDDLISFLSQLDHKIPITIIGAGSNIIIRDGGIEGVVIKLGKNFTDIGFDENGNLYAGAGGLNFNVAKFCQNHNITGLEFLVGIPGTIGGGIAMNAGAYGSEFKDIVIAVEAVDYRGKKITIENKNIGFEYRKNNLPDNLIFTKVIFHTQTGIAQNITQKMQEIIDKRSSTQPIKQKTGGSSFANPKGYKSWQLIDQAGMRGFKIGGASMSQLHCNFMINDGSATADDLEKLGDKVRKAVYDKSGIDLHWEIKIKGRKIQK